MKTLAALVLIPVLAFAGDLVGKAAPEPELAEWIHAPEGPDLAALRGHVVLVLVGGAGETRIPTWNDLRAAYREDGLRVIAVVEGDSPEGAEFCVAKGTAKAYGDGARAVLIAADGEVAWEGGPRDLPEDDLAALLRKARPVPPDEGAEAWLDCWQREAARAASRSDPAEAIFWLERITKHFPDSDAAAAALDSIRELKADRKTTDETRAADNYVRLREERRKAGDSDRKIAAWRKKAERIVTKYDGTVGAARVARLLEADLEDPAIAAIRAFIAAEKVSTSGSDWRTSLPKPPVASFAPGKSYFWLLETSEGRVKLRFFPDVAPMHVTSFIYMTELGYFDGLTFHRVIPGFMAQGGCPLGNGTGAPGYRYDGEFSDRAKHDRPGILSTANSGPGTDGSQFFITFVPYPSLDGKHTVFGVVVEGEDALKRIEKLGSAAPKGTTSKKIVIERATVVVE